MLPFVVTAFQNLTFDIAAAVLVGAVVLLIILTRVHILLVLRRLQSSWVMLTARLKRLFDFRVRPAPTDGQRLERFERLRHDYAGISDDTITTFLLKEAKERVQDKTTGIKGLESRAATQIGIIVSGLGLLSILGPRSGEHLIKSPFLYLAIGLFLGSFVLNIIVVMPTDHQMPSLERYNDTETVRDKDYKARVQLEYTEGVFGHSRRLEPVAKRKGLLLFLATLCLVIGVFALVGNFMTASNSPDNSLTIATRCLTDAAMSK